RVARAEPVVGRGASEPAGEDGRLARSFVETPGEPVLPPLWMTAPAGELPTGAHACVPGRIKERAPPHRRGGPALFGDGKLSHFTDPFVFDRRNLERVSKRRMHVESRAVG